MQQRDLLKEEAERLGRVLGKLVTLLLRDPGTGGDEVTVAETNRVAAAELQLDFDHLLTLDKSGIRDYLEARRLAVTAYTPLADYLDTVAEVLAERRPEESDRYRKTAEWIFQLRDEALGEIPLFRI